MRDRLGELQGQLAGIEEELRDLAFESLRDQARDPEADDAVDAARMEKRFNQARRAIARAIGALDQIDQPRAGT